MSHEQISPKINEILLESNNNNRKSYHSSKVVEEKKYSSKDEDLIQASHKVLREQARYVKLITIEDGDTIWRGYGNHFRDIIDLGIQADKERRGKLQHTTSSTLFPRTTKRKYRGDVVVRLVQIQEELRAVAPDEVWNRDEDRYVPFTKFTHVKVVNAVKKVLGSCDKRTLDEYVDRVTLGCPEIPNDSGGGILELKNFLENKFGRERKKRKNARLDGYL